jgi:hypothetical protein
MNSPSTPEGPGSVSGAPYLPDGFADTFTSRYIDTRELRQHVVTGDEGPPVLPVHGWPQTWYAWRLRMPGLPRHFQIIAPDQDGTAPSGKPGDGHDTCTLAAGLVARCEALFASGLQRSDAPTAEMAAEAIQGSTRRFGIGGCASRMAQEFGDHPDAAAERMRWIRQLAAEVPAGPPMVAVAGRASSAGTASKAVSTPSDAAAGLRAGGAT